MSNFSPFGSIPVPKKGRTNFDLSHSVTGNFGLGYCQPVFYRETIPGDSFDINVFNISKLETLIAPAMQRIDASLLWFKIPKRLVYNKFKDWYSGGKDGEFDGEKPHIFLNQVVWDIHKRILQAYPLATEDEKKIYFLAASEFLFGPGSLWNYLGLPIPLKYDNGVWKVLRIDEMLTWIDGVSEPDPDMSTWIDMMPFMAYNMLYDTYFMDQSLSTPVFVDCESGDFTLSVNQVIIPLADHKKITLYTSGNKLSDGGLVSVADFVTLNQLFKRAWRKEYFTSALPTPQRGPEVTIALSGNATVSIPESDVTIENPLLISDDQMAVEGGLSAISQSQHAGSIIFDGTEDNAINEIRGSLSQLSGSASLQGLSPITITAFRNLFRLQSFLEKNNVSGGRFIETILAQWAERVPDFTIQRPVHVRSTSIPLQISEVTATANSSGLNANLGDQAGRARSQGNLGKVHIYTQEPCFIFGLYCVTCPPAYANQGIDRSWQRITRFDEPWRDFQHIGEQAIKNRELFLNWTVPDSNDLDFGYQQRFSEFKYMPDRVVGDFQTSLSYWHMARMFSSTPYLNNDFITCSPDERIFAVSAARPVIADFYFQIKLKSKLSRFSTPKLT